MSQRGWKLDIVRCVGCHACSVACKAENNTRPQTSPLTVKNQDLADTTSYRWVVFKEGGAYPYPTNNFVTMACHHCLQPACKASCPVGAISKRESDGIVLIDQDKCIGCKYCVQTCPYGAPQFNSTTKKAEKCTFCVHRIDAGLKPACETTCVGRVITSVSDSTGPSGTPPSGFADVELTNPAVEFES